MVRAIVWNGCSTRLTRPLCAAFVNIAPASCYLLSAERVADGRDLASDRDTTLITYNWVRGKKGPTANFNVERECPDDAAWTELSGWLQQHQITRVPAKPANVTELPAIP